MSDRDDIDMRAWTRRTFDDEPMGGSVGDTMRADLTRAHDRLSRRRRWTGGFSALAVAAVAFVIAMSPNLLPSGDTDSGPAGFAGQTESPKPDRPSPDQASPNPDRPSPDRSVLTTDAPARPGDGFPYFDQRHLLFTVAKNHLDPSGEHLSMASNVQGGGGSHGSQSVGTKLNWKVRGESGLGMVQVGIATPGLTDADRRFEIGCGGSCDRHDLGDGTSAWVRRSSDGVIGAAYEQSDGGSVWVLVDPLFGNNSLTPVSSVDVSVDDLLAYVTDPRLRWLDSNSDQVMTWDGRVVPEGCPRGNGDTIVYPNDPPPGQAPPDCPSPSPAD